MSRPLRKMVKWMVQRSVRCLPAPAVRMDGPLAISGGRPVRDIRFRPWPDAPNHSLAEWYSAMGPAMRRVFLSGREGLPQTLQKVFAKQFADYCQCQFALMLPHGSDALRFALAAALDHDGLDYGGEVIVPNLSFIASATCPLDRRFGVALVDVDPDTLNLDPDKIEEAIIPGRTRAILPVHQFGQPAQMTAIMAIAKKHGLKVIEDAAQSHGAVWETGPVGSLGDAAGFSFQSAKNLTCGEGGLLTTNDPDIYHRAQMLHNAGRLPEVGGRWEHASLGWNCRPTEYQAALLIERFRNFPQQQERRAANFQILREALQEVRCLRPLAVHPGVRQHGMYMFVMRYDGSSCGNVSLDRFLECVRAEGAPLNRCYASTISEQPVMKSLRDKRPEYIRVLDTPVSDQAAEQIVYIASSVFLGHASDMRDIALAVRKVELHFSSQDSASRSSSGTAGRT